MPAPRPAGPRPRRREEGGGRARARASALTREGRKVSARPGAGCRADAGERCAGQQRGRRAGPRGAARGAAVATGAVRRGAPRAREGRAGAFGNGDGPGRRGSGTTAAAARGHNPGGGRWQGGGRGRSTSTDPPLPVTSPRGAGPHRAAGNRSPVICWSGAGGEVVLGLEKACPSFNSAFCIVCSNVLPTEDADGEHLIHTCLCIQDLCF